MRNFKNIKFSQWRQYENIDLDLSSNVTVVTGKNGTGKTTLLNVLARHFGWNVNLISTPYFSQKKRSKFWSDVKSSIESDFNIPNNAIRVGSIQYDNGVICALMTKNQVSVQYQLTYQNQQTVHGLNIPSHRPKASYNAIPSIPTSPKTNQQRYQEFQNLMLQTYHGNQNKQSNPGKVIKESLISLAVFGYGNEVVKPNEEYRILFEGFQEILRKVLPSEIGFEKLEIRMPDVVLITKTGSFILGRDVWWCECFIYYFLGKFSCSELIRTVVRL